MITSRMGPCGAQPDNHARIDSLVIMGLWALARARSTAGPRVPSPKEIADPIMATHPNVEMKRQRLGPIPNLRTASERF